MVMRAAAIGLPGVTDITAAGGWLTYRGASA
jgi:hypothetical protein